MSTTCLVQVQLILEMSVPQIQIKTWLSLPRLTMIHPKYETLSYAHTTDAYHGFCNTNLALLPHLLIKHLGSVIAVLVYL